MYRKYIAGLTISWIVVFYSYTGGFGQAASESPIPQTASRNPASAHSAISDPSRSRGESSSLLPFGFDLFNQATSPEVSPEAFPLPADYRLGPGDRVGIFLLGEEQKNFNLTVNVEGKVYVPPAGVIAVGGLSMEAFRDLLDKKLRSYFSNYTLEVMLLEPKRVQVSVVGEVQHPDKYILSALQTVFDAVKAAGGPVERGSMRDIRLYRNGELFASVDLYEFLMHGEPVDEIFLEMGDRVYVPVADRKVRISGEVHRPGIFELKPDADEKLSDLVELAGKFTEYAYLDKIEISRLLGDGHREILFSDYANILSGDGTADNIVLQNEDRVRVYSRLEQIEADSVDILGEVRRPGRYALEKNMRVADLILKAGNLTRSAYVLEAQVAKVDPLQAPQMVSVDLAGVLNGGDPDENVLLEADDQVFVRKIPEWKVGPLVEARGEVMFPGFYPIVEDSTRLSELLNKAGGFTPEAMVKEARLLRKSIVLGNDAEYERLRGTPRDQMSRLEYEYLVMRENLQDLGRVVVDFRKLFEEGDKQEDVTLREGDVIDVPRAPGVVHVTGRVARAGGITYEPAKNLNHYLAKAGGLTYDGDRRRIKVIKATGEILDDEEVRLFEPGDTIWVPRKRERNYWQIFRDTITVAAQLATLYLVVDRATR